MELAEWIILCVFWWILTNFQFEICFYSRLLKFHFKHAIESNGHFADVTFADVHFECYECNEVSFIIVTEKYYEMNINGIKKDKNDKISFSLNIQYLHYSDYCQLLPVNFPAETSPGIELTFFWICH